jgi:hypothetical protein
MITMVWQPLDVGNGTCQGVIDPVLGTAVLAFDDIVSEYAEFLGRWQFGKDIAVEVNWFPDVPPERSASAVWGAKLISYEGTTTHFLERGRSACWGARMIRERLTFHVGPHGIAADEMFKLVIYRAPEESDDTLCGDAKLACVAMSDCSSGVTEDPEPVTPYGYAISDEEYARRAGFYRGPKP